MIPLLFESQGWQNRFQKIVVVDCTIDNQIQRVILRNNIQQEVIEKIIATQAPRAVRLQYADHVLNNNGTLEELNDQVISTHQKIIEKINIS